MRRHFSQARAAVPPALLCAALLGLGACSSPPRLPEGGAGGSALPPAGAAALPDPVRSRIVFTALQMVGTPYRYGGDSPTGFDCSGLVQYAYRSAGLSVPRTSRDQLAATAPVPLAEAGPGDLVFFRSKDYSHVGIYLGEGRFVHAPATGRTVAIGSFNEAYYRSNFVRAGRMQGLAKLAACGERASGAC